MSDPVYTYDEEMGKGAFSIHEIELHTDGVKVGEGWSLMLRQKGEEAYNQIEEEAIFILPDIIFFENNPFDRGIDEGDDYYQKIVERAGKPPSGYEVEMIDEKEYEEFYFYDEAYDVWKKNVKEWMDDFDSKKSPWWERYLS